MFLCFTAIRDQKARWRAEHLTRLDPSLSFSSAEQTLGWLRSSKIGYNTIGDERLFGRFRSQRDQCENTHFYVISSNKVRSRLVRNEDLLANWQNYYFH